MVKVEISYNPYTVTTNIRIGGKADVNSPLQYVKEKRLQEWIQPMGKTWKGIFGELKSGIGDNILEVYFTGTNSDFKDLEYAKEKYGSMFKKIKLVHVNKDTADQIDPASKFKNVKTLYKKLENSPVEDLKSATIKESFENAINSDFRITVVAPMSSGKSTLINAILGQDLLPAFNKATTAVITEIRCNDSMEQFVLNANTKYGREVAKNEKASQERIEKLNDMKDPNDDNQKESLIELIQLEGKVPNIPSKILNTVFVDTPGGNNSENEKHKEMMIRAIEDEKKSLILYVFDGTNTTSKDSDDILSAIAEAMKRNTNGKQTRDRFLFVANKMDEYDCDKEPFDEYVKNEILPMLSRHGIEDPRLFLVSANTAKLIRKKRSGAQLSRKESRDLGSMLDVFRWEEYMLPIYSTFDSEELMDKSRTCLSNAERAERMGKYDEADRLKMDAAEINSGVPTLEAAINEYLEKYAVAIKIKALCDSFMTKVREKKMVYKCESEWNESQESFQKVTDELKETEKTYNKNNKLKELKEKVNGLNLKYSVSELNAKIYRKLADFQRSIKETEVRKEEANHTIGHYKQSLKNICDEGIKEIDLEVNNRIKQSCTDILKEYQDYINELDGKEVFNIGNFNIKNTVAFNKLDLSGLDYISNEFISKKLEVVGKKWEKKEGVLAAIARFFGKGGRIEVDVKEYKEYVNIRNFYAKEITLLRGNIDKITLESINVANEKIKRMKDITNKNLDSLDNIIQKNYDDLKKKTTNRDTLSKIVAANKGKFNWLNDYIKEVEALLAI